jgi:hypothetical protein
MLNHILFYVIIYLLFYTRAVACRYIQLASEHERPRILGLTASPIPCKKGAVVEKIVSQMDIDDDDDDDNNGTSGCQIISYNLFNFRHM